MTADTRPGPAGPRAAPLAGVRILDMTRIMAGPFATQVLADLGAHVIKVERPGVGDDTRVWGPPFLKDRDGRDTPESAYNLAVNRGKESVTVDFSTGAGQDLIRRLARKSDVLVENYVVGTLAKHGLSYEDLRAKNPGLIYCSITGFGQSGPYARRRGYDFALQGMSGLMSVTGERDGRPGAGPEKVGVATADIMAGMYAVVAITSALHARHASGVGQHIDVSLLDAQVAMMANQNLNYFTTGVAPVRLGNAHPNIAPYQCFRTLDGHLVLTVGNDAQFARFCSAAGLDELASDPRFRTNPDRVRHRDELVELLSGVIGRKATSEWLSALDHADVPCGPVNSMDGVFEDEQVRHRGLKIDLPHPLSGTVANVRTPIFFSGTPLTYERSAPLLGQDTERTLRERLGLADEDIRKLREQAVI